MKALTRQHQQALLLSLLIHASILWIIHPTLLRDALKPLPTLEVQLQSLPLSTVAIDRPPPIQTPPSIQAPPSIQVPPSAQAPHKTSSIPPIAPPQPAASELELIAAQKPATPDPELVAPQKVAPMPLPEQSAREPVEKAVAEPTQLSPITPALSPADREAYKNYLTAEIQRQQRYPFIARMRNWQGSVMVTIRLSDSGHLMESRVAVPSGHEVLDGEAMNMVSRAAAHFKPPPLNLVGDSIQIPIQFSLTN